MALGSCSTDLEGGKYYLHRPFPPSNTPALYTWPVRDLPYQEPAAPLRPQLPSFKRSKFFNKSGDDAMFAKTKNKKKTG